MGNNGSPDIVDYAEGFANSAQVLLSQVLKHRGLKYSADTFVYPICFNMRHSIELYVKAAIDALEALVHHEYRLPRVDTDTSHDIGRLWRYFKENSVAIDRRYKPLVESLDRDINDFAEVDATGQVFRYPFGRENQKHLTELAIINLGVMWRKFPKLIENLKTLSNQGRALGREYRYKTFTAHLSRFDLICIAYRLPPRDAWTTAAFDEAKAEVRKRFGISSNEFSRAVKVIEENMEMAALIDAPRPLSHVTTQQLFAFFDAWCRLNDLDALRRRCSDAPREETALPEAEVDGDDSDLIAGIHADALARQETWPQLMAEVTPEAFGEIDALLRFARDNLRYSEEFARERDLTIRDFLADGASGEAELRQSAFHILEKTSAMEHVLDTLRFFGHIETVRLITRRYGLVECSSRLLENSSRWLSARYGHVSDAMGAVSRHPANELFAL
ncbi:hypothetical protein [Caballeronia grimmiae]|uniref:hypothetical protein n=1 Tax=Caballeronia grimmiae TaxID=1071679 RepID=UPI0038B9D713